MINTLETVRDTLLIAITTACEFQQGTDAAKFTEALVNVQNMINGEALSRELALLHQQNEMKVSS